MNFDHVAFGKRLRETRKERGMTQEQLANALNISKNTLVNYETGKSVPKIDVAKRMANLYGLTVNDIKFF